MRAFLLVLVVYGVSSFQIGAAPQRASLMLPRTASPTLFFNRKQEEEAPVQKNKKRSLNAFYDDEINTVSDPDRYNPDYVDNGEVDLANVGGAVYLAFVPFLLLILASASGLFSFGYSNGNF